MVSVIQHDQNVACKDLRQFQESSMCISATQCQTEQLQASADVSTVYTVCFIATKINHDKSSKVFQR